jgi:hypothetical protein
VTNGLNCGTILVHNLSVENALKFVQARIGTEVDAKAMMHLFDNVGTNAAMLNKFIAKSMTVDEFISEKLQETRRELVAFPLQEILVALKQHPDGVDPEFFKKKEYKGIDMSDPSRVGVAMKGSNAFLYDMQTGKYKLMSQAHVVALRKYDPLNV